MPEIGSPADIQSKFNNIKMKKAVADPIKEQFGEDRRFGDYLNELAGVRPKKRFVDKNTHNKIGKDGFLKLLSHQLANQDPLKPMDQKRFAADLAQFSQLEQLSNIKEQMQNSQKNIPVESKFYGSSFLGKKVLTGGATIKLTEGKSTLLPFYLSKSAKHAIIKIYDEKNNLTRQIEVENLPPGGQSIKWNGERQDGVSAKGGVYRFSVSAYDEKYQQFPGETRSEGVVTGVNFDSGQLALVVDGNRTVFLRDVKQFTIPDKEDNSPKSPILQSKKR